MTLAYCIVLAKWEGSTEQLEVRIRIDKASASFSLRCSRVHELELRSSGSWTELGRSAVGILARAGPLEPT